MCIDAKRGGRRYLLGTEFAGFGQRHACAVRPLQKVAVGRLVALHRRGPVVVGVLGIPGVRPPLQLVTQPLHGPRPLPFQVAVTLWTECQTISIIDQTFRSDICPISAKKEISDRRKSPA